jgi:hypothetical protein
MMAIAFTAGEWKDQAERAGQTIDKYMSSIAIYDEVIKNKHDARSATDEDREKIKQCLEELDGNIFDISVDDILTKSNVRRVQGTSAFASHHLKVKRLTYQMGDRSGE